jgi:hypothetical protein
VTREKRVLSPRAQALYDELSKVVACEGVDGGAFVASPALGIEAWSYDIADARRVLGTQYVKKEASKGKRQAGRPTTNRTEQLNHSASRTAKEALAYLSSELGLTASVLLECLILKAYEQLNPAIEVEE